jgi:hypothetical protein
MKNDNIKRLKNHTEEAEDSVNGIKEDINYGLDTLRRVGIVSKRTASAGLGFALGCFLGVFFVSPSSPLEIPAKYESLLLSSMIIGGACGGAFLVKESVEDEIRRIEDAISNMGNDPNLAELKKNLIEQHKLLTQGIAAKHAKLDDSARPQYTLVPATEPEVYPVASTEVVPVVKNRPLKEE